MWDFDSSFPNFESLDHSMRREARFRRFSYDVAAPRGIQQHYSGRAETNLGSAG
jgi:hypothetical protein